MCNISTNRSINYYIDVNLYSLILFLVIGISFIPIGMQGFDVTDTGYHITNQYELIPNIDKNVFSDSRMVILTNLLGGVWLHFQSEQKYYWAIIGGSLVLSLTAVFVYKTVCLLFPNLQRFELFLIVGSSSFLIGSLLPTFIEYYTFPALIQSILFYIVALLVFQDFKTKVDSIFWILLGFLSVLLIISRANLIIVIITLLIYIIIQFSFIRLFSSPCLRKFILFFAGLCLGGLLFLSFLTLHNVDLVELLLLNPYAGAQRTHSFFILMRGYLLHLLKIGVLFAVMFSVLSFFKNKSQITALFYKKGLICLFFASFFLFLYSISEPMVPVFLSRSNVIFTITAFIITIAIYSFIEKFHNKNDNDDNFTSYQLHEPSTSLKTYYERIIYLLESLRDEKFILFFLFTIIAMFLGCIGSGTGFLKVSYTLLLPFSISVVLLLQLLNSLMKSNDNTNVNKFFSPINYNNRIFSKSSIYTIIILILISSLYVTYHFPYRDFQRGQLIEPFNHPSLAYIYSNPERVAVVDDFLFELDRQNVTGKTVLFMNSIPIMYYLTGSHPAYYQNPWPTLRSEEQIWKWQNEIEKFGNLPIIFAMAKYRPANSEWPKLKIRDRNTIVTEKIRDYYVETLHYSKSWENDFFIIYNKPKS